MAGGNCIMDAVFETDKAVFNYRVAGVWIQDGHVLLHKSVNDNHWALPGGRVEITEESQKGLFREFQEELGIDVKVERLLWSVENFFDFNGTNFHEIGFYYKVSLKDDYKFSTEEFYGMEGDHLIYKWIPIDDLDELSLQPEFLKAEIKDIPMNPKHIVVKG